MYKVVWLPSMTRRLTALFLQAVGDGKSKDMTRSVAHIDKLLKFNPNEAGESREEGRRIVMEKPVAVKYEVVEDEKIVVVVEFGYRRPN